MVGDVSAAWLNFRSPRRTLRHSTSLASSARARKVTAKLGVRRTARVEVDGGVTLVWPGVDGEVAFLEE